jgi:calcium/calmodulin-dependent protein kinase I
VVKAEEKATGMEYAIKIIDKKALKGKTDALKNEIDVLTKFDIIPKNGYLFLLLLRVKHPNIVGLIEQFDAKSRLYLVMEL